MNQDQEFDAVKTSRPPLFLPLVLLAGAAAAVAVVIAVLRSDAGLPQPGTDAYEQTTRLFYRGLAALDVGLLDDARREFEQATEIASDEPAVWANLAVAQLRLGSLDEAVVPIERARSLDLRNADLELLAGRMEIARGRIDEGLVHLRRAVELDPNALRARFALADEIERSGTPTAEASAFAEIDQLARLAPRNTAILVDRARLAARRGDLGALRDSITRLEPAAAAWPPLATEQFTTLQQAAAAGDFQRAQIATTFLRNVLASVASFREDLAAVRTPTELVAEPVRRFIRLDSPLATPAAPDLALAFQAEPLAQADLTPAAVAAMATDSAGVRVVAAGPQGVGSLGNGTVRIALPGGGVTTASGLAVLDWNNDFRLDLAAAGGFGVRLLLQDEAGGLVDATPAPVACDCVAVWPADVEMDGDLDLVAAPRSGGPQVLRNDGNGAWTPVPMFAGVSGARGFGWADVDRDGDPDAVLLDDAFALHAFRNRQAGDFVKIDSFPALGGVIGFTIGDIDADGVFDVIALDRGGQIRRIVPDGDSWSIASIAPSQPAPESAAGSHHLFTADLDNNGALDLIGTGNGATRIWMADERRELRALDMTLPAAVHTVADFNADGRLDLLGVAAAAGAGAGQAVRLINRGTTGYHWKAIRTRAQPIAGDQRINSFGVGGEIEVRSGLLLQKQVLTGGPVHVGLGDRTAVDVARIVWPNGVAQAEFDLGVDDELVAQQRLKGSCPWVFAWDGTQMAFVTDFLWRSPLGLRINAQDTAGVLQTEDWVRIAGSQLAPRDGVYDIRITAELWETHFFDHVSLMVVDRPDDTDVFVDERFSPASPPVLALHAVRGSRPVAAARDHTGNDVTDLVAARDGRHLATFARGAYQGIAEAHHVEIDVPAGLWDDAAAGGSGGQPVLLASGWIYPTDSSINVAIGQGGHVTPMGLSLEAQQADGRWSVVHPDLGFPAGKNKTIVVDLAAASGARRLRLRTNLEIYWDALAVGLRVDAPLRTRRLQPSAAELRYRGFSVTESQRGDKPETPLYDRLASRSPQWRDLIGYHTRFGAVDELLDRVDDRYVIMNAGDEMRLLFPEQPPPAAGWTRDFVLIGDGWEKDGDYNTGFSQTVLPLPSHDKPDYGAGVTSLALEDDPVYQRHRGDWQTYHTRYVTPQAFVEGLRNGEEPRR